MTTQHITQDQIDAEVSKLDPIFLDAPNGFLLSFASAAIQWDREQRAKELPVLPHAYDSRWDENEVKAYGEACAAHAREVALEEAMRVCKQLEVAIDGGGNAYYRPADARQCVAAIEALTKAGK